MSNLKETAEALAFLGDTVIKLNEAKLITEGNLKASNEILSTFLSKVKAKVESLDLTKVPEPKFEIVATPVNTVAPVIQPVVQTPASNVNELGERLYAGKTLKELQNMNSGMLNTLAQRVSQYPNASNNVPKQEGLLEDVWRGILINFITSNAQYVA